MYVQCTRVCTSVATGASAVLCGRLTRLTRAPVTRGASRRLRESRASTAASPGAGGGGAPRVPTPADGRAALGRRRRGPRTTRAAGHTARGSCDQPLTRDQHRDQPLTRDQRRDQLLKTSSAGDIDSRPAAQQVRPHNFRSLTFCHNACHSNINCPIKHFHWSAASYVKSLK